MASQPVDLTSIADVAPLTGHLSAFIDHEPMNHGTIGASPAATMLKFVVPLTSGIELDLGTCLGVSPNEYDVYEWRGLRFSLPPDESPALMIGVNADDVKARALFSVLVGTGVCQLSTKLIQQANEQAELYPGDEGGDASCDVLLDCTYVLEMLGTMSRYTEAEPVAAGQLVG